MSGYRAPVAVGHANGSAIHARVAELFKKQDEERSRYLNEQIKSGCGRCRRALTSYRSERGHRYCADCTKVVARQKAAMKKSWVGRARAE